MAQSVRGSAPRRKKKDENDRFVDGTYDPHPRGGLRITNPSFARGDHAELADALLDCIEGNRDRLVGVGGGLWHYDRDRGIWHENEHDALRRTVKSFGGAPKGEDG